jgi:hypothetical protein
MMLSVSNIFSINISKDRDIIKQSIFFESKFNFDLNYAELKRCINKDIQTEIVIKKGFTNSIDFLNLIIKDLNITAYEMVTIEEYDYNLDIKSIYLVSEYIYICNKSTHILPSKMVLLLKFDMEYDNDKILYIDILGNYRDLTLTIHNNFNLKKNIFPHVTNLKIHYINPNKFSSNPYQIIKNFPSLENLELYFKYNSVDIDNLLEFIDIFNSIRTIKFIIKYNEKRDLKSLLRNIDSNISIISKY